MKQRIGVIGGSGLYEINGLEIIDEVRIETPFGDPSDLFILGHFDEKEVVFLPRHGRNHSQLPSEINFKANIWGLKKLGVEWIISVSAVGSFKKEIKPCDVVLIDQFFDRTNQGRPNTFFGDGIVGHIMFAHPICQNLQKILFEAAQNVNEITIHNGGTYLNMEGPAFSTKAESLLYKSWGMDVIGMTNLQEAKLAREAEICYATLAMVTDWDCWIEGDPDAVVNVEMIVKNLEKNIIHAKTIIRNAVQKLPVERTCECCHALENAIMTRPSAIPPEIKERLSLIISKTI